MSLPVEEKVETYVPAIDGRDREGRKGSVAALISVAGALVGAVVLLVVPFGESVSSSVDSTGHQIVDESRFNLSESEGWSVVVVLAVPVLFAAVGTAVARARPGRMPLVVSAVLLWAFVILGTLSVGLYFLPSALAMTIAAVQARS